jgi:hypothetical protein
MSATDDPKTLFEPRPGAQLDAARRSAAVAKGNRNRLAQRFFSDLNGIWDEQGEATLRRAFFHDPVRIVQTMASLMPQRIEHASEQAMSDERYAELLDAVHAAIQAKRAQGAPPPSVSGDATAIEGGGGPPVLALRGEVVGPIHAAPLPRDPVQVETAKARATPVQFDPLDANANPSATPVRFLGLTAEETVRRMREEADAGATPRNATPVETTYTVVDEEDYVDPASLF